jgi:hypothetical protein
MRVNGRQLAVESAEPARLITRLDRAELSGCGPTRPTVASQRLGRQLGCMKYASLPRIGNARSCR